MISYTYAYEKDNKIKSKEKLKKVIYDIASKVDIEIKDFKKAIIKPETEEDKYYLCDGSRTKVNHKKVISYIRLNKKDKLIIFKQIANQYKYHKKDMEDVKDIELYLLESVDLKNEGFINVDNTLNKENPFIKKLSKKH